MKLLTPLFTTTFSHRTPRHGAVTFAVSQSVCSVTVNLLQPDFPVARGSWNSAVPVPLLADRAARKM